MRGKQFTFVAIIVIGHIISAAGQDLKVQLMNPDKIEFTPGRATNIVIRLINQSDSAKTFQLKINSPEGWNQLSDYSSINVESKSSKLKILSFFVNSSTASGDYQLEIVAIDKGLNKRIDKLMIPVYVNARYSVTVQAIDGPEFVAAGDSARVKFIVRNTSNVAANIHVAIPRGKTGQPLSKRLEPDSVMHIMAAMETHPGISSFSRNSLGAQVKVEEDSSIHEVAAFAFNVIPTVKINFDRFNRFPVKISALTVAKQLNGEWKAAGMFDIRGKGQISQKKERLIDFHFRGPDRQGNPLMGYNDMYYINYAGSNNLLMLGDNNYSLTDLTELSRHGRGLQYEHALKSLSVGGFINYPRYYPKVKRIFSAYSSYTISEGTFLKAGYLNKLFITDTSVQLYTISGGTQFGSWLDVSAEYAMGTGETDNTAYKATLNAGFSSVRAFINYTKAGKNFAGYLSNSQFLSSGFTAVLLKKLNISARYNMNNTNYALDTLYANAPQSKNMQASINYIIGQNHHLGIGVYAREREDKMEKPLFHYKEQYARLSSYNRIGRLGLNLYGEIGTMNNLLEQTDEQQENAVNARFAADYTIGKFFSIEGFLSYKGSQQLLSDELSVYYYGGSLRAAFPKWMLMFRYRNNYTAEEYYRERSLLALSSSFSVGNNHEISLGANYNLKKNSLSSTEAYANLRYTYTLNLPVSKKFNTGSLTGRIINNGVETLEGIICTLAGNVAITGKDGSFEFPGVKTGTYYLMIDISALGLYAIAETPGPYKIEVAPGDVNQFSLSITKSGWIKGRINIQEDENKNKPGYIPIYEELGNLIVEAKKGEEVYRKYTRSDGSFVFDNLRPGNWHVKVYKNGIPKGYELLKDQFDISLQPGASEIIEVNIRKLNRRIKFQKSTIRR